MTVGGCLNRSCRPPCMLNSQSAAHTRPSSRWIGATSNDFVMYQCPNRPKAQHPQIVESRRVRKNARRGVYIALKYRYMNAGSCQGGSAPCEVVGASNPAPNSTDRPDPGLEAFDPQRQAEHSRCCNTVVTRIKQRIYQASH